MKKKKKMYALYKGDTFLTLGYKEELAVYLGVSVRTIEFYHSPVYRKRTDKGNGYIVITIEEDKE